MRNSLILEKLEKRVMSMSAKVSPISHIANFFGVYEEKITQKDSYDLKDLLLLICGLPCKCPLDLQTFLNT